MSRAQALAQMRLERHDNRAAHAASMTKPWSRADPSHEIQLWEEIEKPGTTTAADHWQRWPLPRAPSVAAHGKAVNADAADRRALDATTTSASAHRPWELPPRRGKAPPEPPDDVGKRDFITSSEAYGTHPRQPDRRAAQQQAQQGSPRRAFEMYAHTDDRTLDDRTSNRQDYRVWPSQRLDRLKQGLAVAAAEPDRTVGAAPGLDVDAGAGFDDTSMHRADFVRFAREIALPERTPMALGVQLRSYNSWLNVRSCPG